MSQGIKALIGLIVCGFILFLLFRSPSETRKEVAIPQSSTPAPVSKDFRVALKPQYRGHETDVLRAVELARRYPHCTEVIGGSYDADPTSDGLEYTPYYVTCRVDNSKFPGHPYANYFYTRDQIDQGYSAPSRVLGADE